MVRVSEDVSFFRAAPRSDASHVPPILLCLTTNCEHTLPLSPTRVRAYAKGLLVSETHFKGLFLRKASDDLDTFTSNEGKARLLTNSMGVEVIEVTLKAGGRVFLVPPTSPGRSAETYYVISGTLRGKLGEDVLELGPGDCITLEGLQNRALLTASEPAKLLCVTAQPVFDQADAFTSELMQLAVEVERKDGYTADHCRRLQKLSYATAEVLGLGSNQLYRLNYGAYLHDLGKVKIPLEILQKPSKLTLEEWNIVKRHPIDGRALLHGTQLEEAGIILEQHHERFDGSGYPYGLRGEQVLTESYIVAVADTYDAMTTDRPYCKALSPEVAFAELKKYAGIHYPEEVVEAFLIAVSKQHLGQL